MTILSHLGVGSLATNGSELTLMYVNLNLALLSVTNELVVVIMIIQVAVVVLSSPKMARFSSVDPRFLIIPPVSPNTSICAILVRSMSANLFILGVVVQLKQLQGTFAGIRPSTIAIFSGSMRFVSSQFSNLLKASATSHTWASWGSWNRSCPCTFGFDALEAGPNRVHPLEEPIGSDVERLLAIPTGWPLDRSCLHTEVREFVPATSRAVAARAKFQ